MATRNPATPLSEMVQGGVHPKVVKKLKEDLDKCKYNLYDPNFFVLFFSSYGDAYNGEAFGFEQTDNVGDLINSNIHPVNLHDPTMDKKWQEQDLRTFYDAVDHARRALHEDGKKLVVVCMLGKNRSMAVKYALDPKASNLPSCLAMQSAAKGYLNQRDMSIVPLGPSRGSRSQTASAEDAPQEEQVAKKSRKE